MVSQTKQELWCDIRVQTEIEERLMRLAELMGVPPGILGAFAIESWVAQQERTLALIEAIGVRVGGDIGDRLKEMLRTGMFSSLADMPHRSRLTGKEIAVIAEHENLSEQSASGLGNALLQSNEGISEIARFINENIYSAALNGHDQKAEDLRRLLVRFRESRLSQP
jgi:hypothetical protein